MRLGIFAKTYDRPDVASCLQAVADANGGDRSFEERLRDIIKAHDTLKTAGLC